MSRERRRLALALLVSLLIHALLLSLTFGGQGPRLPGFGLPWQDRRTEGLRVVLVPTQPPPVEPTVSPVAELPWRPATIEPPVVGGRAPKPKLAAAKPTARAKPVRSAAAGAAPKAPLPPDRPSRAAPPQVTEPAVIDAEPSDAPTWVVPVVPSAPTSVAAAASSASSPQVATLAPRDAGDVAQERIDPPARERPVEVVEVDPADREAQRQAEQQETTRIETARLEAERQEAARQAAAQLAAARQEAARLEAARVEAARREAELQEAAQQAQAATRQEVARQEAARQEAARVEATREAAERQEAARQAAAQREAARQEAVRQEAERVDAARQEAARIDAARQEAARVDVARQEVARREAARVESERQEAERQEASRQAATRREAARVEAEQEESARREAVRRAIGRQLDEEAARRAAASTAPHIPNTLPFSLSTARRVRLWGRTDPNVELVRYAEAWARKIQSNTAVETVRDVAKRPHTPPMVTVAVRSDGSVESVTFVVSSGVAEVDEAIRRAVQSQTPYQAFPPALAREVDVIEIRRTWSFDDAIRLH